MRRIKSILLLFVFCLALPVQSQLCFSAFKSKNSMEKFRKGFNMMKLSNNMIKSGGKRKKSKMSDIVALNKSATLKDKKKRKMLKKVKKYYKKACRDFLGMENSQGFSKVKLGRRVKLFCKITTSSIGIKLENQHQGEMLAFVVPKILNDYKFNGNKALYWIRREAVKMNDKLEKELKRAAKTCKGGKDCHIPQTVLSLPKFREYYYKNIKRSMKIVRKIYKKKIQMTLSSSFTSLSGRLLKRKRRVTCSDLKRKFISARKLSNKNRRRKRIYRKLKNAFTKKCKKTYLRWRYIYFKTHHFQWKKKFLELKKQMEAAEEKMKFYESGLTRAKKSYLDYKKMVTARRTRVSKRVRVLIKKIKGGENIREKLYKIAMRNEKLAVKLAELYLSKNKESQVVASVASKIALKNEKKALEIIENYIEKRKRSQKENKNTPLSEYFAKPVLIPGPVSAKRLKTANSQISSLTTEISSYFQKSLKSLSPKESLLQKEKIFEGLDLNFKPAMDKCELKFGDGNCVLISKTGIAYKCSKGKAPVAVSSHSFKCLKHSEDRIDGKEEENLIDFDGEHEIFFVDYLD